jgi:hypothetical protein
MGEPDRRHEERVRRQYSYSLIMLILHVDDTDTHLQYLAQPVRVHMSSFLVSSRILHGTGAFGAFLSPINAFCLVVLFLIFRWIPLFGVRFSTS